MIKIIAKNYSQAVKYICDQCEQEAAHFDVFLSNDSVSVKSFLKETIGVKGIILIGNVGEWSTLFADTFGLPMFYDKYAEKNILQYCKLSQTAVPPQHILDKLCVAPESFNHYSSSFGYQCTCYGEYKKSHIYIIPDDSKECSVVFDNYLKQDLFKNIADKSKYTFKLFGLSEFEINKRLSTISSIAIYRVQTINLDSKVDIIFPNKCARSVVNDVLSTFKNTFGEFIYATTDISLFKCAVDLLNTLNKTVSVAESLTGGLISSSIVDVAGASAVFIEGFTTYSIASKCKRLGISPHYVDEHGVVSQQVAQSMATGLRQNGCDFAISTTGYAGPTAEHGLPVGLCYIGLATEKGVSVYRNIFSGDRNSIRAQAANTAMYLLIKYITK